MRKKGIISPYSLQTLIEGSQGRNLKAGTETKTTEEWYFLVCSSGPAPLASYTTQAYVSTSHSRLSPHRWINNWENVSSTWMQNNLIWIIIQLRSPLPRWLRGLIRLTSEANCDLSTSCQCFLCHKLTQFCQEANHLPFALLFRSLV